MLLLLLFLLIIYCIYIYIFPYIFSIYIYIHIYKHVIIILIIYHMYYQMYIYTHYNSSCSCAFALSSFVCPIFRAPPIRGHPFLRESTERSGDGTCGDCWWMAPTWSPKVVGGLEHDFYFPFHISMAWFKGKFTGNHGFYIKYVFFL